MKNIFTTFTLLLCSSFWLSAQVNLGATAGTTSGSYPDLKVAFDSINSGYHQGVITIELTSSHSLDTMVAKIGGSGSINNNGNGIATSNYTSIHIQPTVGVGVVTISGKTKAGYPMIDLNGADNVTIDGLNTAGDLLVLSNDTISATANTCTIRLVNDAQNNVLKNAKILTMATVTLANSGGAILISTGLAGGSGNDNNTISNCVLSTSSSNVLKLLHILGSTTNSTIQNSNIVIANNYFENFKASGVYVGVGARDITVSNNHFYHTINVTPSASTTNFAPIYITNVTANLGENFNITGNYIGGTAPNCGGAQSALLLNASTFQPIYLSCAKTAKSYISNNTITNLAISITTSTGSASYGIICVQNGKVDVVGNIIGNQVDTGSFVFNYTGTVANNLVVFWNNASATGNIFDTLRYENNKLGSLSTRSGSTGISTRIFDLKGSTTITSIIIRNNLFGSPTVPHSINSRAVSNNFLLMRSLDANPINKCEFVGNYAGNITHFNTATGSIINGFNFQNGIWRIDSNIIENMVTNAPNTSAISGIVFTATTTGSTCTGNKIRNLVAADNSSSVSNVYGINATYQSSLSAGGSCLFAGNKISNLYTLSTSVGSASFGIRINGGSAATYNVNNNEIIMGLDSLGISMTTSQVFYGINRLLGNANIYHNAVLITGSGINPDTSTYAFVNTAGTGTADVRNNVFVNNRSFHTGSVTYANYAAVYFGTINSGAIANLTSNYNLYYTNGIGGVMLSNNGNISYTDLPSWRGVATAHDANSVNGDPLFVSNAVLGGISGSAIVSGDPALTSVTVDITGGTRSNPSLMGAYNSYNPTPVKLVYVRGVKQNANVKLTWATASETNNKGFYVERSIDGKDFKTIGFVKGNGTINKLSKYEFMDMNVDSDPSVNQTTSNVKHQTPNIFYRLNQIDFDGKHEYSQTILVTNKQAKEMARVEVFPNPFNNLFTIDIADVSTSASVVIYNLQGKEVYNNSYSLQDANTTITIENIATLPIGLYVMHLTTNGVTSIQKIVKQ
jgi:hypothetical protein